MGFFDAIKKNFDAGGIKVKIDTPKSFKWSDGSIPVTVTLTGHKTEPRTVTNLRFTLEQEHEREEDDKGSFIVSHRSESAALIVNRNETIELQPLEEVTVQMDIPLATDGEAGSTGAMVGKAMDVISTFSGDAQWYTLAAHTTVEGAKQEKGASRRIRNGGLFGGSISFGR